MCRWWTLFWRLGAANFVTTKNRYTYLCSRLSVSLVCWRTFFIWSKFGSVSHFNGNKAHGNLFWGKT